MTHRSEKLIKDEILHEMRQRDISRHWTMKLRVKSDSILYKTARYRVVTKINDTKREFVENKLIKPVKNMWKKLNEFYIRNRHPLPQHT